MHLRACHQNKRRANRGHVRRETMKTTIFAAVAALSLGIGSAYAETGGTIPNTFFTQLPGVTAKTPAQNVPAAATTQDGRAVDAYVTQSSRGTWLFAPSQNGDGTNN
jgi:hypothetical protein